MRALIDFVKGQIRLRREMQAVEQLMLDLMYESLIRQLTEAERGALHRLMARKLNLGMALIAPFSWFL